MKKILLRSVLLLLVAIMCCQLAACGGDEGTGDQGGTTAPSGGNGTTAPVVTDKPIVYYETDLVLDGATAYTIVYPANTEDGSPVMDAVLALQKAFKDNFNIDIAAVTDATAEVEKEIVVGATNRAISAQVLADMNNGKGPKYGEAIYALVGTKMAINGTDGDAVEAVMASFIDQVIEPAQGMTTLHFHSSNNYHKTKTYFLELITIDGVDISEFVVVVPELNSTEHMLAKALVRQIAVNNGTILNIVDDSTEAAAHEIRVGMTNRTSTTIEANQYAVIPAGGHMEIAFSGLFGASELSKRLINDYFNHEYFHSEFKLIDNGQTLFVASDANTGFGDITFPAYRTYDVAAGVTKADSKDIRVMFHDVYGHLNTANPNPAGPRADFYIQIYETYQPDILCLQEAAQNWPTEAKAVLDWLDANGYGKICLTDKGGASTPIFYKENRFQPISTNYYKLGTSVEKGITAVLFKDTTNGKFFGVTNAHFSGTADANNDAKLAVQYRNEEATLLLQAKAAIHAQQKDCPIFSGGNYNATVDEKIMDDLTGATLYAPIQTILDGGYTNVRDLVADESKVSDFAPYHGASAFVYHADYDFYEFRNVSTRDIETTADHVFYAGAANGATVKQYLILTDSISGTASDHLPHFIDTALN